MGSGRCVDMVSTCILHVIINHADVNLKNSLTLKKLIVFNKQNVITSILFHVLYMFYGVDFDREVAYFFWRNGGADTLRAHARAVVKLKLSHGPPSAAPAPRSPRPRSASKS